MKTVEDEVFCYKGYMFSVFVVLRYFVIYCMQYICYNTLPIASKVSMLIEIEKHLTLWSSTYNYVITFGVQ